MPDYKTNDPRGWWGDPKRGAALGRPTIKEADKSFDGKLTLRKVRLNSGGYDSNGNYFGTGKQLWWVAGEGFTGASTFEVREVDYMLRAVDREEAKRQVREDYPKARFYR